MRTHPALLFVALAATAAPAVARKTASDTSAVVVTRLSFVQFEDLEFGTMLAGPTGGTVVVSPFGVRTGTGGVTLAGGTVQAARFAGYGFPNQFVSISVNANTQTMARAGGTETMNYGTFIIGSTPTAPLTTTPRTFRIASATGFFSFPVGATLNVAANQKPGYYSDTFTITLNYQ